MALGGEAVQNPKQVGRSLQKRQGADRWTGGKTLPSRQGRRYHQPEAPAVFTYRVRGLVENRQPASNVNNYLEDLTSGEERQKALHQNIVVFSRRDRGSGRPTKKERRIIDKLKGPDK
jgi:hypothetical protein